MTKTPEIKALAQDTAQPVLIAGAGIGGLTAALALARAGRSVVVIEKRTRVEETGAGIQLSPNASRILIALGLGPALSRAAGEPDKLVVRRGLDGSRLCDMPLGRSMRERFGAPYYVVHRADLQTILLDAVRGLPQIRLVFGRSILDARTQPDAVEVTAEGTSGVETLRGSCVVGADGLWSRVAPAMGDSSEPVFCGYVAWRGTVPVEAAPKGFQKPETGLWVGPDAHVVHYPVRGGRTINVVAVLNDRNSEPGWSRPGDPAVFRERFKAWTPELRALFEAVPEWQVWSLFDRPPRKSWTKGRIALLGDAAHPVLPFLAQGGACAIEDAAVLAACLAGIPHDVPLALKAYEAERRPRASEIQSAARRNGQIYHMAGPMAFARDLVMTKAGGERLLRRYDWLYGWVPVAKRG